MLQTLCFGTARITMAIVAALTMTVVAALTMTVVAAHVACFSSRVMTGCDPLHALQVSLVQKQYSLIARLQQHLPTACAQIGCYVLHVYQYICYHMHEKMKQS